MCNLALFPGSSQALSSNPSPSEKRGLRTRLDPPQLSVSSVKLEKYLETSANRTSCVTMSYEMVQWHEWPFTTALYSLLKQLITLHCLSPTCRSFSRLCAGSISSLVFPVPRCKQQIKMYRCQNRASPAFLENLIFLSLPDFWNRVDNVCASCQPL